MNRGEKKTAPPIPVVIAIVAMRMETGRRYQSSRLVHIRWPPRDRVEVEGPALPKVLAL
jgi:hypothetical protein